MLHFDPKLIQLCWHSLLYASLKADFELVYLLLTHGVEANQIDETIGTGVLHEAVRFEHNRNRFNPNKLNYARFKIIKYLSLYGASAYTRNRRNETPMQLALVKSKKISPFYTEALSYFNQNYNNNGCIPVRSFYTKYPLIKTNINWTRNDPRYFSGFKPNNMANLSFNLIDGIERFFRFIPNCLLEFYILNLYFCISSSFTGNPTSMCSFDATKINWIIFDLKSEYAISKLRVYCWYG
jgi:hypothetical protein